MLYCFVNMNSNHHTLYMGNQKQNQKSCGQWRKAQNGIINYCWISLLVIVICEMNDSEIVT